MLEPKDIEILISKPKATSVTTKSVALKMLGFLALMTIIGYVGLTTLCNLTNPPPKPWIIFEDTNKTNPDTASFQNCHWSEGDKSIVVDNTNKPFSFGYLHQTEYSLVRIDPTKSATFDDSAAFWGWVKESGSAWSYYPLEEHIIPSPASAKFLREVHPAPEPKMSQPPAHEHGPISTKAMKHA